jgi:hypothetical protein
MLRRGEELARRLVVTPTPPLSAAACYVSTNLYASAIQEVERWSRFLRQPGRVDSPIQRTNHHEDAEAIFG